MNIKYIFLSTIFIATTHHSSAMEKLSKYKYIHQNNNYYGQQEQKEDKVTKKIKPKNKNLDSYAKKVCPKSKYLAPAMIMASETSIVFLGFEI